MPQEAGRSVRRVQVDEETTMGGFLDMLMGGGAAMDQAKEMFGGELPNIGQITNVLGSAPEAQIQQATRGAMQQLPASELGALGGLMGGFLNNQPQVAQTVPNLGSLMGGITGGNADVMGNVMGGLLKSNGLGMLTQMFEPPAQQQQDGLLDNVLEMFGIGGDDGKFGIGDLIGLMQNPIASQLLTKLLPALMKLG